MIMNSSTAKTGQTNNTIKKIIFILKQSHAVQLNCCVIHTHDSIVTPCHFLGIEKKSPEPLVTKWWMSNKWANIFLKRTNQQVLNHFRGPNRCSLLIGCGIRGNTLSQRLARKKRAVVNNLQSHQLITLISRVLRKHKSFRTDQFPHHFPLSNSLAPLSLAVACMLLFCTCTSCPVHLSLKDLMVKF